MYPQSCKFCGMLFMNPNPSDIDLKLCNNCTNKEIFKMENTITMPSGGTQLLIQVNHIHQVEIEEICMNRGLTLSEYLIGLHVEKMKLLDEDAESYLEDNNLQSEKSSRDKAYEASWKANESDVPKRGRPRKNP